MYRGVPAQRSFIAFGTYIALFPQLIAGPIVRYRTVAGQLVGRAEGLESFGEGIRRFVAGLGKKVLLANNLGLLWQQVQQAPSSEVTVLAAWLGIIAFALQLYFDFSGYSDMAIGLGKMFGFTFPENFHPISPGVSRNSGGAGIFRWEAGSGTMFTSFGRKPPGNRRFIGTLLAVWLLTGCGTGPAGISVLWGLYYG